MTRASSRSNRDLTLNAQPDAQMASSSTKQMSHATLTHSALQPALPHTEPTVVSIKVYLRLKLENLLLSPKTRKVLAVHDVQTLGQLCRLSATQLATLPGIGPHSLSELHETLDYYGVSFAPEPSSLSKGKKRPATPPLCLPGLELSQSSYVCRVCHKPQVSSPIRGGLCSAACRQSARSAKPPITAIPASPVGLQLALPLMPEE